MIKMFENHPIFGTIIPIIAAIIPFFDVVTPSLQVLSLIIGIIVGIITAYLQYQKLVLAKMNTDERERQIEIKLREEKYEEDTGDDSGS